MTTEITRARARAALETRLAAAEDALAAITEKLSSPYVHVQHEFLGEVTPDLLRTAASYQDAVAGYWQQVSA
jgi:hypothetical protein